MTHRKLKLVALAPGMGGPPRGFRKCPVTQVRLQGGEMLKRGCGRRGMSRFDAGWHCFYCGRYLYERGPELKALWFHFRLAREYWRVQHSAGRDFVNGMPVPGLADPLPPGLWADLAEPEPPLWFGVFVQSEEEEFRHYLETRRVN